MRALVWMIRCCIFVFLLAFALKNTEPVSVNFFYDISWQAPLVIVILISFIVGAFFGVLSLLGTVFTLRRQLAAHKRDLSAARAELKFALPLEK